MNNKVVTVAMTIILCVIYNLAISQTTIKHWFPVKYHYNKFDNSLDKFFIDVYLTISYDDKHIEWKTYEEQPMSIIKTHTITNDYIIGVSNSGNVLFFDINNKQFYYISYSKYNTIISYGKNYKEVEVLTKKIGGMLNEGYTISDVIVILIYRIEKNTNLNKE
jgi:hypothetical protein